MRVSEKFFKCNIAIGSRLIRQQHKKKRACIKNFPSVNPLQEIKVHANARQKQHENPAILNDPQLSQRIDSKFACGPPRASVPVQFQMHLLHYDIAVINFLGLALHSNERESLNTLLLV